MNRTFFRRRRRFVLGLAFAALAVPATGQAASTGLSALADGSVASMAGPSNGLSLRTDSQQSLIDRHRALGNLGVATAPAITPLQADGMRLTAIAREYLRNAPASAMIDGWAYRFVNRSGGTTVAPTAVVSNPSTSFNWNDAGVGASIAFGAALLLTLSVVIGRRRHTRTDRTGLASA
jgi:hypothetical protein